MTNIEKTKSMCEAFMRGDIPALFEHFADDIEWDYDSLNDVPWYRPRRGKAEVAGFFECLAQVEMTQWEPTLYLGEGDLAVVVLDSDYRIKSNGRRVVYKDCLLLFQFNAAGKLARFNHRVDLFPGWLAYHDRSPDCGDAKAEMAFGL